MTDDIERATADEIATARLAYATSDIVIDDDAAVSRADSGTWVQAWVHIADD